MVHKRKLPQGQNPLLGAEHTPPLDILIERRRLGQTNLVVKPGQVGITNATKTEALGKFDYAHLRVPLPKDLRGSGIFTMQKNQAYPESYFLMRRSSDGYISATGMFKAAFPWASIEEEAAEREYHKSLPSAGPEEVAGNVWIAPEDALKLAEEYHMLPWIVALLDPEPIEKGTKDKERIEISTPPKFVVPDKGTLMVSQATPSTRLRSLRSASPSKTPSRKMATPRKPRTTRNSVKKDDATTAGSALQNVFTNGIEESKAESVVSESVDDEPVRVEVDEIVEATGDTETTTTIVKVEMPPGSPELRLPESTEEMIAKAKAMVEEANRLEENRMNGVKALKRKADDLEDDDEEVGMAVQPAKRMRIVEEELKKEKVKNKALIGLSATLAIGALLPYFL